MIFERTIQKANLIMKLRSMGISSKTVLSQLKKFLEKFFTFKLYRLHMKITLPIVLSRQSVNRI